MKRCPDCGLEMDDRARFCSLCGFEFADRGRQNPPTGNTPTQGQHRQVNATNAFSPTDDTIYFSAQNGNGSMNRDNIPGDSRRPDQQNNNSGYRQPYGRSEDTSARPPVRRMEDTRYYNPGNMNTSPGANGVNGMNRSGNPNSAMGNTGNVSTIGGFKGANFGNDPSNRYSNGNDLNGDPDNSEQFDNYGFEQDEQQNPSGNGVEADKLQKNKPVIILSIAAVVAVIILVILIFVIASRKNDKENSGKVTRVTTQVQTQAPTQAPEEETEAETEEPTEAETKAETTKAREKVKAEDIAERRCYINTDSDDIYSYKSEYVLNDMDKNKEKKLWNGLELSARRTCHSHKTNWYECWSSENGEYIGWVDEKFLTFGQKEKPKEQQQEQQQQQQQQQQEQQQEQQKDPIYIDNSNILHVDFDISAYDFRSIQDHLDISLEDPSDFPFWGIEDLGYSVADYKGHKLCFVFRYDRLEAIVYETIGTIDQNLLNSASAVYGNYNTIQDGVRYGFNANRGFLYILEQDQLGYTNRDNQDVVHQRIMVSELYNDIQNQN